MAVSTTEPEVEPKAGPRTQKTVKRQQQYTTDSVISKDGTTVGYRQIGVGPGILLLHGAMESAQSHFQLAEALASTFTIYMPDRRGRGLSGPFGRDYNIQKEVEDLTALLTKTSAHYVFGVSSGAVIALQASLTLDTIHKLAVYEPALIINGSLSTDFLTRFDSEIAHGKVVSALVTGMKGSQMGPPIFNLIPRFLLERLTRVAMEIEEKNATGDSVTMRAFAPTLHYDFQMVVEMENALESFRLTRPEVLLLGGSKSPSYLKVALDALEKVLPHAKCIRFRGFGHGASGNKDRGGKPERVAQELKLFFA